MNIFNGWCSEKICNILVLVVICWLQNAVCYGQIDENHLLKNITDRNGLPQNSVKSIVADEDGFIWLATENGLVRFDGVNFYTFNNSMFPSFSNRVYNLSFGMQKSPQKLYAWMENDRFLEIFKGTVKIDTMVYENQILRLCKSNDLVSTIATGYPYEYIAIRQKNYLIPIPNADGSYFEFRNGMLDYYANWKKVQQLNLGETEYQNLFRIGKTLYSKNSKGEFTQIYKVDALTNTQQIPVVLQGDILKDPNFKNIQKKELGFYWNNAADQVFLSLEGALYQLKETRNGSLNTILLFNEFDFVSNGILSVYRDDKNKQTYLGSRTKGLFIVKEKLFQVLNTTLDNMGNMDNVFYAQSVLDSNTVLTPQGIILGKTPGSTKVIESYVSEKKVGKDMSRYSIQVDSKGLIWTMKNDTLYQYDRKLQKIKGQWAFPARVPYIYIENDSSLWLGVIGMGVYRLNPMKEKSIPKKFIDTPFINSTVNYFVSESKDTLWIGTNKGLYRVHVPTRKTELIKGTELMNIRSLSISKNTPSQDAEIWMGSLNGGFALYKNGKLTRFPLDKQNYLSASHCIIEDHKGFIWIPTNKGLFQISKSELLNYAENNVVGVPFYMYYSSENGLRTNEFNGGCLPCAVRLLNGNVSLPSLDGLVWFKPENISPIVPDKAIVVDRFELNGKILPLFSDSILLSQDFNQLNLYVTTPFFGVIGNLHFSYALKELGNKPLSSDWLDIEPLNSIIHISRLAHGNYSLHIRKRNGFGEQNYSYKTIYLEVPPKWFETIWFYLFCAIVFGVILYALVQFRFKNIAERNNWLENEISIRTQKLKSALKSLENSQSDLSQQVHLQSRLMASIAHDVRTPLGSVVIVARGMRKMIHEKKYDLAALYGRGIEESMQNIQMVLEDLLAYIKAQVYNKKIKYELVALNQMIQDNFQLYGHTIQGENTRFVNKVSKELTLNTSYQLLDIILHNIIDNAIKFTRHGEIRAYTTTSEKNVKLTIENSGNGMPDNLVSWLNCKEITPQPDEYNGLGLLMVKEIAQLIHIGIDVEQASEKTLVNLTFNLAQS